MAILPTAHASQRFGSRTIDFYVAPGQVIGSDPRARADERRIQDLEGERHPVRVAKRDFALDPGDYAAVIRLQPGPKRRSRPVAVVNYRTNSWTRTHADTPRLLSRAGVARNMNWLLAVLAFAGAAVLIVWPQLVAMLSIFAPGLAAGLPVFDIFAVLAGLQPGLADARLTEMAPALTDILGTAAPQLAGHEGAVIFAIGVLAGLLVAFGARSWRFAWIPVFLAGILAGAIAIAGPDAAMMPALLALAGSTLFFMLGGFINRWRDSVRLEARVARLADHVLRHPPEEMVTRREEAPALSDTTPAAEADEGGIQPVAAVTAAGVAAIGAAAISARSTGIPDDGDTAVEAPAEAEEQVQDGSSDQDGADAQAGSGGESEEAGVPEAQAVTGAETEAGTGPDAPGQEEAAASSTEETTAAEAPREEAGPTQTDPRHEARSMDIAPPPPMPSAVADEARPAETPVNRDADGEAQDAAEQTVLESDEAPAPQQLEGAGENPDGADSGQDAVSGQGDDEIAGTQDAFGGGEEKRE